MYQATGAAEMSRPLPFPHRRNENGNSTGIPAGLHHRGRRRGHCGLFPLQILHHQFRTVKILLRIDRCPQVWRIPLQQSGFLYTDKGIGIPVQRGTDMFMVIRVIRKLRRSKKTLCL